MADAPPKRRGRPPLSKDGSKSVVLNMRVSAADYDRVLCENSAHSLRGRAVVELEEATEPFTAADGASADDRRPGLGDERIAQTLVGPFFMIVIDKRTQGGPQMPFAQWHDAPQALGSD
jgi:hypothetical protein